MSLSLQTKLIASALSVTVILALTLTWLSFGQLKASVQGSLDTELKAQTTAFTTYLASWADDRSRSMSAIRDAITLHLEANNGKPDSFKIREILSQGKSSVDFGMTFLGMEDGTMIRFDKKLDEGRTDNYDPRVRGWYKAAKKNNQALISKPYIAATAKKLAITFVEPIFIDGRYVGATGGLVYMDKILTNVLNLKVQGNGYAILLDKANLITAHPQEDFILKETTVLGEEFTIDNVSDTNNLNKLVDINVLNEDTLIYVSEIDGTNWLLSLIMKKDVLNEPMSALLIKTIIIVIILLAIATIGITMMIRWLFTDLKSVSLGLENIANGNGDLTLRINTNSNDEIGVLANNFNHFVSYLQKILSNVNHVGQELDTQADAITVEASSSAEKIRVQQDEMTMISTAVSEMTTATKDIAENAVNASTTAENAVTLSGKGQEQVRKSQTSINALAQEVSGASEVILKLDKHVQDIGTILSTISGIAEQTNLLALNAAIEAARAGEQGRGFAVVADEVRVLSQRTHSSTEEIQKTIEVLQNTTQHAVTSMSSSQSLADTSVADAETASESLSKIQTEIMHISDMATQIATAAEEQTAVTGEINGNTANVTSATYELAKQSEESALRSKKLHTLTETLKNDLQNFTL